MPRPIVSVVLAAKDAPPEMFDLCLRSFAALRKCSQLEMIVVASGRVPDVDAALSRRFAAVIRSNVEPSGVYAAYNAGIPLATGHYILFFGVDDIALPPMDRVIEHLATTHYDVYAAACYMQGYGVRYPSRRRLSLVFRNWCHQGVFYSSACLEGRRYATEYRVRADHKLNIEIISAPSLHLGIDREPVAYFSAGGESSLHPDSLFIRDFPSIVTRALGWPLGVLAWLKRLAVDRVLLPPERWFRTRRR